MKLSGVLLATLVCALLVLPGLYGEGYGEGYGQGYGQGYGYGYGQDYIPVPLPVPRGGGGLSGCKWIHPDKD
ncbi:hypothetical protein DPMN_079386 [Dreissena polymorpha]|uniref:Uncharacterized protein n=1 Tax=Dreissena polymorpha TaxID=45954 RepID=A0A9D3YT05_DREPO|nr:hypothetical protein DPMN_079386 [Dreissena polymorpha]